MGKATGVAVLREGGTPFLIGRSVPKLEAAQAVVSPADSSLVKIASVDCLNDDAVEAFFHDQAPGSYHHIVCTLGESTEYAISSHIFPIFVVSINLYYGLPWQM